MQRETLASRVKVSIGQSKDFDFAHYFGICSIAWFPAVDKTLHSSGQVVGLRGALAGAERGVITAPGPCFADFHSGELVEMLTQTLEIARKIGARLLVLFVWSGRGVALAFAGPAANCSA